MEMPGGGIWAAVRLAEPISKQVKIKTAVREQKAAMSAYKATEGKFNHAVESYNTSCVKTYYADDMAAVAQKLGLQ